MSKMRSTTALSCLLALNALSAESYSLTAPISTTRSFGHVCNPSQTPRAPTQQTSTALNVMMPPEMFHLTDIDTIHASASHINEMFRASSVLVADAATSGVGDAIDPMNGGDGGWWKSYLNVFKTALAFVHDRIDGPLQSVGIQHTWGPSIAVFTAGVRSALLPLSIQQSKSSEKMKALQPYQKEIKEKFKDNEQLRNQAIAKLFEDSGTNPLSGCLVSLVQFPVLIGLYRSITLLAREGRLTEPFLWIPSLAGPVTPPTYRGMEWLTEGWNFDGSLPIPQLGWETTLAFLAMPLILVLGQSLTMKVLTPTTEGMSVEEKEQMEKSQGFLKFLPLMIGYFSLQVPAGLTIYWLTSNLFTVSQSLVVRAYYAANPPKVELPDYWDALENMETMSPEEKRAAAKAGIATGPSFDDMLDEARFHYVVERPPLREDSQAWERAKVSSQIPPEMANWVKSGTKDMVKEELEV